MPTYKKKQKSFRRPKIDRPLMKKIENIVRYQLDKKLETKEKRYAYDSVGIDPIGGAAVSLGSISYGSSTIIAQLCRGITAGTGEGQRIGHEINLRGCYINLAVQCASGTESNNVRIAVIRPKGTFTTTSVAALSQQIFSNQASSSTQWLNPIDTDFFDVYYDKQVWIKPSDIGAVGNVSEKFFKTFLKFGKNGMRMKWNEADSQPQRDLFVVAISDSITVSHPGAVAGFIRLYYKDG